MAWPSVVWRGLMAGGVAVCCAFVVVWLDGLALLDGLAVGGVAWSDGWRRGGGCAFVVVWLDGLALLDGLAVGGVWCDGLRCGGGCAFVVVWLDGSALLDGLAVGGVCGLMAGGVAMCCAFGVPGGALHRAEENAHRLTA